uniref:Alpha and gamma adaptin binding protein n=1 Tax=Naja naja TaxID=35670 RepID=A0A8C6XM97_NAJNA
MAVPCTLITSCAAGFPGEELVKRITGEEELPEHIAAESRARFYPWTIDNKYYSAAIHLCVVANVFQVTSEIAESIQAFLICFDSTTVAGLDAVSQWLPLIEDWLPEVMILVCDRVSENGISRQKAQEWCIKHSFELVELNPEELPDEDEASHNFGLFPALTGAGRRIGSDENEAPEANSLPAERAQSVLDSEEALVPAEGTQGDPTADPVLDTDIQELASLTAGEGDIENFERLFSKLKEMKEKAATLPHEQRKLHAEKVAKAFWMAIRGDQDEIEGLSSDEDN